MLNQNNVLSGKIRIGPEYSKGDFSKHYGFYTNYSRFTLKALTKSSFQEFLCRMLLAENIEEKFVNTVDIKIFPAPRKNGFNIVGKCDTFRGRIRIYPKTFNFCNEFKKKYGKDYLFAFVGNRARAALIHELLHLKYVSDEGKVRELTDIYFSAYMERRYYKNLNLISLLGLIFNRKNQAFLNK